MQDHLKKAHRWTSRCKAGRPSKADIAKGRATAFPTVTLSPVWYQTFHVSNFRRNFRVAAPLELDKGRPSRAVPLPPASLEAQVELQLTEKMRVSDEAATAIDELACAARTFVQQQELLNASKESRDRAPREDQMQSLQRTLDLACLQFSIALLDHCLMGDIFDSVVVGFLAVLGINSTRDGFQEATTYTPHLSALIKIAQMLILEQAVAAVDDGKTEYPSQMIDDMQDRFMAYRSCLPINWAQKLRSEDRQKLTYRDLELSMSGLKQFAQWQVEAAQEQLQQLLLIYAEEAREDVVPKLRLQDLKDNPALNQELMQINVTPPASASTPASSSAPSAAPPPPPPAAAVGLAAPARTKRAADLEILATVGGAADFSHYLGHLWEIQNSDCAAGTAAPARTKRAADLEILATVGGAADSSHYLRRL
ncbi:hypothetical protein ACLOAV_001962 [Pseudogymnoascus australis]